MDRCRLGNQIFNNTVDSAAAALTEAAEKTRLAIPVRGIRNSSFSATQSLQRCQNPKFRTSKMQIN